jgi:hypothetical protein
VWVYTKVPQTYFLLYWRRLTCEKVILTFIDSYCAREVSVGLYQSSSDLFPIVLEKSVWVYTKVPQTYFLLYWRLLTCEKVILTFIDSYCVREVSVGLYQSSSDLFSIVLEKSVWVYTKVPQTYFLLYWRNQRRSIPKFLRPISYCIGEISVGLYQSSSDLFPIVLETIDV